MHPSTLFFYLSFVVASVLAGLNLPGLPSKIYGVNLGSWYAFHGCFPIPDPTNYLIRLLVEPWMLLDGSSCKSPRVALTDSWLSEWTQMGGQLCTSNCSSCIASELCVILWIFYLDHWATIFKVHMCKPIRTLLTQNLKNIGKLLLPWSVYNSDSHLL